MAEKEFFINDRMSIPEKIKRMSKEQRMQEIQRLEAEASAKKKLIAEKKENTITDK